MKNKKFNIAIFLSILLFLYINTFSIGVNDITSYVTKAEFDNAITNITIKINSMDQSIESKIIDFYNTNPLPYEAGSGLSLDRNYGYNKWAFNVTMTQERILWPTRDISLTTTLTELYRYTASNPTLYSMTFRCSYTGNLNSVVSWQIVDLSWTEIWGCRVNNGLARDVTGFNYQCTTSTLYLSAGETVVVRAMLHVQNPVVVGASSCAVVYLHL